MPAIPAITAAASVAGVVSSVNAQRKAASAQKDALAQQREIANNLKYEPVNIENLKQQTRQQAIQNATDALALERDLSPDVAATRQMVAERVRSDLALGGQLSPDVASQVARAARVSGASSGAPAGPLTASLIGSSAQQLSQQRLANAGSLLAANKLAPVGLDPGALASAIVGQNTAMNQFNAAKAGINANLAESTGKVNAGLAAGQHSMFSEVMNKLPGIAGQIGGLFPTSTPGVDVTTNAPGIQNYTVPSFVTPTQPLSLTQMGGGINLPTLNFTGSVLPTPTG